MGNEIYFTIYLDGCEAFNNIWVLLYFCFLLFMDWEVSYVGDLVYFPTFLVNSKKTVQNGFEWKF